jgi:ComF family protein
MAEKLRIQTDLPEAIIPVPMHHSRVRFRGFNQALEIARPISRELSIPILSNVICKSRKTVPQTQLGEKARKRNLYNSFTINDPINARHVAILDDVITTSATMNELARTLKQHGVHTVSAWSCARSQLHNS